MRTSRWLEVFVRPVVFLSVWLLAVPLWAAGDPPPVPRPDDRHMQAFEEVWTLVRDTHWDPDLGGVDWNAVRERFEPRMQAAANAATAREVLQEMLATLGQSHFLIIPGDLYEELSGSEDDLQASGSEGGSGVMGLEIRTISGEAVVTSVRPGTPAAAAGIEPGWVIDSIDETELAPALRRVSDHIGDDVARQFVMTMAVVSRLQGPVGGVRVLRVRDGADQSHTVSLKLAEPHGKRVQLGHLPPVHVWLEHRRLADGRVGYIAFNAFFDPATIMPAFETAVRELADTQGLIIDVRGNPGGIGAMAMGMAGFLLEESGRRLGTMTTRNGSLDFVVFPRPTTYTGSIAVLVDGVSASTAEIFAGGLKDLGRARVFGRRTSGQALPSRVVRLANGDAFQHAFASFESVRGESLEGRGVEPDVIIELSRDALLDDPDPEVTAAAGWIEESAVKRAVH